MPIGSIENLIKRVSLDWATLIARIYEVNPLRCVGCGANIKISGFITHQAEINRLLRGKAEANPYDPEFQEYFRLRSWARVYQRKSMKVNIRAI